MKKFKAISAIFWALAFLLSNIMCATVAYSYCRMIYGIKYELFSAPAYVAFFTAIPYLIGIAACVALAVVFRRKAKKSAK